VVHIRSLHALVCVANVNAPSHKPFQISEYETFCGAFWLLLSHRIWCHQNIYEVQRNTMLHFSVVCLVNMNDPMRMFTNALHKNIFDKGYATCTLTTWCIICTLTHLPTGYILFLGVSLNEHASVFMFTNTLLHTWCTL
jgi:hypothetical protein